VNNKNFLKFAIVVRLNVLIIEKKKESKKASLGDCFFVLWKTWFYKTMRGGYNKNEWDMLEV